MEAFIKLSKQLIKYAVAALAGLIIDFGSVIFAKEVLGLNYLVSVTIGFTLGLIATYFISNKYVFGKSKINRTTEIILFTVIGIGGLIILDILVWLMTGKLGFNYLISKGIATIAVFLWNFFARRSLYHEA
jgi:putative flippase GtrA